MDSPVSVLIIDDDNQLVKAVEIYLTKAGYRVFTAGDGRSGLEVIYHQQPSLVLLDLMMPRVDGWEVCRRIREVSDLPVIVLTARGQEADKVRGLKMGADDYVTKPFSLKELEARIQAVLRRSGPPTPRHSDVSYISRDLTIDFDGWQVTRAGKPVDLTATERRLLVFLAENRGRILPTARILEQVWGPEYVNEAEYVKLYIWRLRQKIEPDPNQPIYILTERGIGYRFASEP